MWCLDASSCLCGRSCKAFQVLQTILQENPLQTLNHKKGWEREEMWNTHLGMPFGNHILEMLSLNSGKPQTPPIIQTIRWQVVDELPVFKSAFWMDERGNGQRQKKKKKRGKGVASLLRRGIVKRWIRPHSSSPGQETWTCLARGVHRWGRRERQKSAPCQLQPYSSWATGFSWFLDGNGTLTAVAEEMDTFP